MIRSYIKAWKKYCNEKKDIIINRKKECINASIQKLENPKLTNIDIRLCFLDKEEQYNLRIAQTRKDHDDKKLMRAARTWTSKAFSEASQISPPDRLPPWPRKWDEEEREELLNMLARVYKVERPS